MTSIWVSDGLLRKSLAATRTLGKHAAAVWVADTIRWPMASWSKYARGSLRYPDPVQDRAAFQGWLARALAKGQPDVWLPMDDVTVAATLRLSQEQGLPGGVHTCLPPISSFHILADKGRAVVQAQAAGVPVPQTWFPNTVEEAYTLAKALPYPLVVKARHGSGSRGMVAVSTPGSFEAAYGSVHARDPLPILQAFVPTAERRDVCLFFDRHGEVKAAFIQREVRHFPEPHGPSTVQESVHDQGLLERALQLFRGLPWRGVVEVEFMWDERSGEWLFMEANPRFWNSLELALRCGIDFVWMSVQDALGLPVQAAGDYADGERVRSLLPSDLLWLLTSPRRFDGTQRFWRRGCIGGHDDILSAADIGPTIGFFANAIRLCVSPKMWRTLFGR